MSLEEDIITASGSNSTTTPTAVSCEYSHIGDVWVVTYDDGTTEKVAYHGSCSKPYDFCK